MNQYQNNNSNIKLIVFMNKNIHVLNVVLMGMTVLLFF